MTSRVAIPLAGTGSVLSQHVVGCRRREIDGRGIQDEKFRRQRRGLRRMVGGAEISEPLDPRTAKTTPKMIWWPI